MVFIKKGENILINCCDNQNINKKYSIPFCNNCFRFCVYKCYL